MGGEMKIWAMIAAAVLTAQALAQDVDCKHAITQTDMNICADKDYQAADKALNAIYKKVVTAQEGETAKLKAAQRAWMAFRDAECSFQTAASEGGTIQAMEYSMCLTTLTKTRTKQLQDSLACYKDAGKC